MVGRVHDELLLMLHRIVGLYVFFLLPVGAVKIYISAGCVSTLPVCPFS